MLGAWEENSIDLQKPEAQRVLRMNTQKKIIGKWQESTRSKKEERGLEDFGGVLLEQLMKYNFPLISNTVLAVLKITLPPKPNQTKTKP